MVLEVFVDIQGVEVLAVKTGKQHVDDDGDVNFVLRGGGIGFAQVGIWPLLVFELEQFLAFGAPFILKHFKKPGGI